MGNITSLGGTLPIFNQVLGASSAINRAAGLVGYSTADRERRAAQERDLAQLKERNQLEQDIAAKKLATETALINAQKAEDARRRDAALKAAVSRQRAEFGSSGVEPDETGSSEAVLLGLYNQSEAEKAAQDSIYTLRQKILDDNYASLVRRNLLEEAQF